MTARTDAASAMTESVDFWYGSQLLACPSLDPSLAGRIGTGMHAMGYERNDGGRWVKVPLPRLAPESQPPVPALPSPRRAIARSAA